MPRTIVESVGRMGGKNRTADVKVVQELLNNVPASSGGPKVKLDPNGICKKNTVDAIQRFQLHHFGWSGADGRVDPTGPTLAKLNEFDKKTPGAVPPPPLGKPENDNTSTKFAIRGLDTGVTYPPATGGARVRARDGYDYFEIINTENNRSAVYQFTAYEHQTRWNRHRVEVTQSTQFRTIKQREVIAFESPARWTTYFRIHGDIVVPIASFLQIQLKGEIIFPRIYKHDEDFSATSGTRRVTTTTAAELFLVEKPLDGRG